MTTTPHTTSAAEPEVLRLATLLQDGAWYKLTTGDMLAVGLELRRQHDLIRSLQSELEAVGAGGVQSLAAAAPKAEPEAYDHGPQATTIEEAARDVGKWLNERPNRPLDLRHVAMLCAHAQTSAPLQQGEYLPLPPAVGLAYFPESELIQTAHNEDGVYDEFDKEIFTADQMRAYVDADRAARRAPSAQDAADWLVGAGVVTDGIDLAQRLNIGHNRAERLFAAASARQKGGEPA